MAVDTRASAILGGSFPLRAADALLTAAEQAWPHSYARRMIAGGRPVVFWSIVIVTAVLVALVAQRFGAR